MPLTRDEILAKDDLPRETVKVPEWGGEVFVRTMTGAERDAYEVSIIETNGDDVKMNRRNARAKLLVQTVIDEAGKRLFADVDADALGGKSGSALDRIYTVAARLNKLSQADEDELVKNSQPGPSESSGSV